MLDSFARQTATFILTVSLSLPAVTAHGQTKSKDTTTHRYIHYLFYPDSNTNASLMNGSLQYLYVPVSNTLNTGGVHWNIGINVARFFTKQFILGFCYDLKLFTSYTKQHFSEGFVNDFNSDFNTMYSNKMDSARANTLNGAINNKEGFGAYGNTFNNIGIAFSPFPTKYGGILIQVKKGGHIFPFFGPDSKLLTTTENEWTYLKLKNCYSIEICFTPYKFFTSKRIVIHDQKLKHMYKFICVSLFYEKLNFNNATFNGAPLDQFVNQTFISKYSSDSHFGIKLGLALY